MNTKNNRRRRESVERIRRTFVELLQHRELNEITVSEICKRCALNRSTFYANFSDVYDLADKLKEELEGDVLGLYAAELAAKEEEPFHDYLRLFQHMRENRLFYLTYFKLGYDDKHPIKFYDHIRAERDFGGKHIWYHIEFFRAGFNAIVKKWLAGGCKESPEDLVGILQAEYRGR